MKKHVLVGLGVMLGGAIVLATWGIDRNADAASRTPRSRATRTFASARVDYLKARDDAARSGFERLIGYNAAHPLARQARLYLADLSLRAGNLSQARAEVNALLADEPPDPHRTRGEIAKGWLALVAGDSAAARAALSRVKARLPGSRAAAQALVGLGLQELLDGQYNEAVRYFRYVRQLGDSSEDVRGHALLAIAHSLYRAGRYADAEAELLELLVELPEHTLADDARRDLGWCALARGDAVKALETFEMLADGEPDAGSTYSGGENLILRSSDELRQAIVGFHMRERRRPGGPDPLVQLIRLFDHAAITEAPEGIGAARAALGW